MMIEIWGDAGDSFTKWLWNCDNIIVRLEPRWVKLLYKILGHLNIWFESEDLEFSEMGRGTQNEGVAFEMEGS